MPPDCILCQGSAGDPHLQRIQVWEDAYWRLTTSLFAEVPGFSYLEPKRHIPHVTDLDGPEAQTFGPVLARVTTVLRDVTNAELVYVYVFGGSIPHLHVHLAPHRAGDALNDQLIRGEVTAVPMPSGAVHIQSEAFPPLPEPLLRDVAEQVRRRLALAG